MQRLRTILLCIIGVLCTISTIQAQERSIFNWQTPAGRYTDPSSFFSLHGYVDAIYAGPSRDWDVNDPTQIGNPGQYLIPDTDNSSFSFDAALIFGAELSEHSRILVETHVVDNHSRSDQIALPGLPFVITEATVSWDVFKDYASVSGGIFWTPFGRVAEDWLGAENLFTTIPRAAGAFPLYFNEQGVRMNGAFEFSEKSAINYVVSIGNGTGNAYLSGRSGADQNENKNIMSRVGIFPGLSRDLELGVSWAAGVLSDSIRSGETGDAATIFVGNENRYTAFSLDALFQKNGFRFRGYWITSTHDPGLSELPGASVGDLKRNGLLGEVSYMKELGTPVLGIGALVPKFRFDGITRDAFPQLARNSPAFGVVNESSTNVYSMGLNLIPAENVSFKNLIISLEYHIQKEIDRRDLENNRLLVRLTGKF